MINQPKMDPKEALPPKTDNEEVAKEPPKPSPLERARAFVAQKRAQLMLTPVELQIKDTAHAKSDEVVNFCIEKFKAGVTWDELRFMLGCGPANIDRRWRAVRQAVIGKLSPETEEEALEESFAKRAVLLERLEGFLEDVEAKLLTDAPGEETTPQYFKMRLDAVKTLLSENNAEFQNYVELRKVKALEKGNRGVSILVQNNYGLARPKLGAKITENLVQVIDAANELNKLVEKK